MAKINRSNYTIRTKSQRTSIGDIYERDWMVTNGYGGDDSFGEVGRHYQYGEGNFKFYYRVTDNIRKKRSFGEWVKNDGCADKDENVYWSNDCITDVGITSNDIHLNPDYSSLRDFAYFGNCSSLVTSSVINILNYYPAEIYLSDNEYVDVVKRYDNDTNKINYVTGKLETSYEAYNPFDISVISELDNSFWLRNLYANYTSYNVIDKDNNVYIIDKITETGEKPLNGCKTINDFGEYRTIVLHLKEENGEGKKILTLHFCYDGSKFLLTGDVKDGGTHIRPKVEYIEDFFNNLSDFEKVILNRNTTPLYSCKLYILKLDEKDDNNNLQESLTPFTWPLSQGGWNIVGYDGNNFIKQLLETSILYDEYYTNNLLSNMTHSSIKALDETYYEPDDDRHDFNVLGTFKVNEFLSLVGMFFDNIKRKIDNVKNTNTITYDKKNNIPDYFLDDVLDLSGWEVSSPTLGLDKTNSFSFEYNPNKVYSNIDVDDLFYRTLKLNSRNILNKKGTRNGIESILGMFGFISEDFVVNCGKFAPDFRIDEYVYFANKLDEKSTDTIIELNEHTPIGTSTEYSPNENRAEPFIGLPVRGVYTTDEKEKGKVKLDYIIPWFYNNIVGSPYFQMFGGWGKKDYQEGQWSDSNNGYYLDENGNVIPEYSKYNENVSTLYTVSNIANLVDVPNSLLYAGIVVYVEDVADYYAYFNSYNDLLEPGYPDAEGISHYFYLKNPKKVGSFGLSYDEVPPEGFDYYYSDDLAYLYKTTEINNDVATIIENADNVQYRIKTEDGREIEVDEETFRNEYKSFDSNGNIVTYYEITEDEYNKGVEEDPEHYVMAIRHDGWQNLKDPDTISDKDPLSDIKRNIKYKEKIVNIAKGNAPHTGSDFYDDGKEYINYFTELFKYHNETDDYLDSAYDCFGKLKYDANIGFNVTQYIDNTKTWFYYDKTGNKYFNSDEKEGLLHSIRGKMGLSVMKDDTSTYAKRTDAKAINYQTGEECTDDEATSFGIINVKNLDLVFYLPKINDKTIEGDDLESFKKFINHSILPYVTQMIPSTTIFKIKFEERD